MSPSLKSCKKSFAVIFILMIISANKFAHAMTAQLSWHVQICSLIWSLFFVEDKNVFIRFGLWAHRLVVKWRKSFGWPTDLGQNPGPIFYVSPTEYLSQWEMLHNNVFSYWLRYIWKKIVTWKWVQVPCQWDSQNVVFIINPMMLGHLDKKPKKNSEIGCAGSIPNAIPLCHNVMS